MTDAAPMLQQYRKLKAQFPDALLLFRLGDFYEMFDGDAQPISKQLGFQKIVVWFNFVPATTLPNA